MIRPSVSEQFDYEGELAVIIGRAGRHVPAERALEYVAGYTCFNDGSVRDFQKISITAGKNFPSSAPLGPWMVTADELPDPDNIPLSLTVNGETRQSSNTSQLIYNCRRLIEFASEFYTLYPGDLVYTGTPDGVGPVKPGDVIVCRSAPVLGELKIAVRAHEAGRVPSEQRVPA
jgi:2-keto-4-pentenoate hydratase/2-oxohepta-3-ene-1,7-dioic acid hydratase in catechol pathway